MYSKCILILFILLFLLSIWSYYESSEGLGCEDGKCCTFSLSSNLWHDNTYLSFALILPKTDYSGEDNLQTNSINLKMVFDGNMVSHTGIVRLSSPPPDNDDGPPGFHFTRHKATPKQATLSKVGEITIHNVLYVSGISDHYPYFCNLPEGQENSPMDGTGKLFDTRICAFIKVKTSTDRPQNWQLADSDITDLEEHVHICKLVYSEPEPQTGGSQDSPHKYSVYPLSENLDYFDISGTDETITMYIYEGFDFNDVILDELKVAGSENEIHWEKMAKLTCDQLLKIYSNRSTDEVSGARMKTPNYNINLLYEYIHTHVCERDEAKANYFMELMFTNSLVIKDYFDNSSFKDHLRNMVYNALFFYSHNRNYNITDSGEKRKYLQDFVTLKIECERMKNHLLNSEKDALRLALSGIFDERDIQDGMSPSIIPNSYLTVPDKIEIMVIGDEIFLRIPNVFQHCDNNSEFFKVITTLVLMYDEEADKYSIKYTDACRFSVGWDEVSFSMKKLEDVSSSASKNSKAYTYADNENNKHRFSLSSK